MAVRFFEDGHRYESIDLFEDIEWISVSNLVKRFCEPFDEKRAAEKACANRKSKWWGIPVQEILDRWEAERNRSTSLGTWFHSKREKFLLSQPSYLYKGIELPIFSPEIVNGAKIAPEQKLQQGVYPEHFIYLKSVGVCGQSDQVKIVNNHIQVSDMKTNKELKTEGYKNWEGISKKLLPPLAHIEDCHLSKYALQLSIYAYMIWRHNPQYYVDNPIIEHIIFEVEKEDEFGYPITRLDENGEPIVKDIVPIEVPYMKREVELMFDVLKAEKQNVQRNI